ncbi:hypothetical protein PFISCL1PPCAC_5376, partial [Pristionchus fissidentatus]
EEIFDRLTDTINDDELEFVGCSKVVESEKMTSCFWRNSLCTNEKSKHIIQPQQSIHLRKLLQTHHRTPVLRTVDGVRIRREVLVDSVRDSLAAYHRALFEFH